MNHDATGRRWGGSRRRTSGLAVALAAAALLACGGLGGPVEPSPPPRSGDGTPGVTAAGPTPEPSATIAPEPIATAAPGRRARIAPPPPGRLYHAVHPGGPSGEEDDITPAALGSYEAAVGKTVAWVYVSHNWYRGSEFPLEVATWIRETGSVPYIRLMLRSDAVQGHAESTYTLQRIVNGEFDRELRAWAAAARDFGTPLMAEYGTEVNGEWFPWNGAWHGGGSGDGYGDPAAADGPERFRDAYRRIIRISRDEGADNITWVFHVNNQDIPDEPWNRLEQYYPGDEWIDWIGVSVYGAQTPMDSEWPAFRDLMDEVYPRLEALSADKSIVVLEFGVTAGNPLGDQADWADSALADLIALRWPRVIGFSWWNETWQNDGDASHDTDMRVQDNHRLAEVFHARVGLAEAVLGRPEWTGP